VVYGPNNLKEVNAALVSTTMHLIALDANLRIQYRRAVNQADNKAATVSIDSLINYEAVKVRQLYLSIR
jgi:ABC-type transport system involved in Fe-S cluster assembly fused permease/ATPase subunit